MKTRTFVGCVFLIIGFTILAYDAEASINVSLRSRAGQDLLFASIVGFWSNLHLTSISNLWTATSPAALQEIISAQIANSLFDMLKRPPVAFVLIFSGSLIILTTFVRRGLSSKELRRGSLLTGTGQLVRIRATKRKPPKLSSVDREFLPAALEIIETPTSPIVVALIWFTCFAFSSALAWSYFGQFDIYAVARGKIEPNGQSKVVQPYEPGKVVAVHVENGSFVRAGDVLVELDRTETTADQEVEVRDLEAARAETTRRRMAIALVQGGEFVPKPIPFDDDIRELVRSRQQDIFAADLTQLSSAIASLKAQLSELEARHDGAVMTITARTKLIKILKERVDTRDALDAEGNGFRSKVIDALQEYERENTNLAGDQGQVMELDANKRTTESKIRELLTQFIRDQTDKLGEAEQKKDHLDQELIKATTKNNRTRLTAPISGIIQQLTVTTIGQVVVSGQAIMTIVPQDASVEVEAMIQNQDIGFVGAGQLVTIKVDAFPFSRYGTLDGTVINISRDGVDQRTSTNLSDVASLTKTQGPASSTSSGLGAVDLAYPVKIAISRQTILVDGQEIRLTPGMAITAEIKTGQRRAIDYLLSPLREIQAASFGER